MIGTPLAAHPPIPKSVFPQTVMADFEVPFEQFQQACQDAFEASYRRLRAGVRAVVAKAEAAGRMGRTGLTQADFGDRLERRPSGEYADPTTRLKWHAWVEAWHAGVTWSRENS